MVAEKKYSKEFIRTFILFVIGGTGVGALLLFPEKLYFEAIVYTIMLVIALTFFVNFKQIQKYATYHPKRTPAKKLYGVGEKPLNGIFLGVVFGIAFLVLSKVKLFGVVSMSLAYPELPMALSAQGYVVTVIAPVIETIFFSVFLLSILGLFMNFWMATLTRAGVFTAYHGWAYILGTGAGTAGAVAGAFLGAFIFAILGSLLAFYIGSEADASAHGFANFVNWNEAVGKFSII